MKKKGSYEKNGVFPDQRPSEFKRQHKRATYPEKRLRNRQAGSRDTTAYVIRACLGNARGRPSTGQKMKILFDGLQMIQFAKLTG